MRRNNKSKQQPIPSAIQSPVAPEKSAASFAPDPKPVSTFAPVSGPLNVKPAKPAISSEAWNDLIQKKAGLGNLHSIKIQV